MGQLQDVVERYFAALDRSDIAAVEVLLHPDEDFAAPGPVTGNAQVELGWIGPFLAAFPDVHHHILRAVESDGLVAVEITITGTFTNPLASPQGDIPATGRALDLPAANFFAVSDGRIGLHHIQFDQMAMLGQLGLLPS